MIAKSNIGFRGLTGAIDPQDRARFDRAVEVAEAVDAVVETVTQAEGAAVQASEAAVQAAQTAAQDAAAADAIRAEVEGDAIAAENARAGAETIAASVDAGFYRRDYFLTQTFANGIGNWASLSGAASAAAVGGELVLTAITTSAANFPQLSERIWQRTHGLAMLRVTVTCRHTTPLTGAAPQIRTMLQLSNDGSTAASTIFGPAWVKTTEAASTLTFDVPIPQGYTYFRLNFQFRNHVGNAVAFSLLSAKNADLERSITVARKTVAVSSRSEILAAAIGDADVVHDRSGDLYYKRLPVSGSASGAPVTMGDGTVLIPAWDTDPRMWGAVLDGQSVEAADNLSITHTGTQSWSPLVRSMIWCANNDKTLFLPEGRFFATNLNETVYRDVSAAGKILRIKGRGREVSQILWNDHRGLNGLGRLDFLRVWGLAELHLADFGIIGDWRRAFVTPEQTIAAGGHLISGSATDEITLRNVELSGSHYFAFAVGGARHFEADGCKVTYALRDGLHADASRSYAVTNCDFFRVFDDAVASHAYNLPDEIKPVAVDYYVSGNRFEQAQGIALVGASRARIHNNIGRQIYTRWIDIRASSQVSYDISVTDNYCEDTISQVQLSGLPNGPSIGGDSSLGIGVGTGNPGPNAAGNWEWESDGATVVKPFARLQQSYLSTERPPANFGITVARNQFTRSIEYGRRWSDLGRPAAALWTRVGPVDPVITESMLCKDEAITVSGALSNVTVEGNEIFGHQRPIRIGLETGAPATLPNRALHRVNARQNRLTSFGSYGIYVLGSGVVDVDGNHFDGDPLFERATRNANGTWSAVTEARAVLVDTGAGRQPTIHFLRNTVANVSVVTNAAFTGIVGGNIVRGDFVGVTDAANKGIRDLVFHPNRLGTLIYEGSDATDNAGFLKIKHVNQRTRDAMPSSGHWIAGTVVDLTLPVVSGADVIIGYLRLTTGTSHVLGTDWRALLA